MTCKRPQKKARKKKAPSENQLAINQQEFAQRMGVSIPTARAMMNREGFPAIRVGRVRLIPLAQLERWLEEQATGAR